MKRLLILFCVTGLLAALALSHVATAARPEPKVLICHVNSANDILDLGPCGVLVFGKVIEVSENAVDTHVTQHGDSTEYCDLDKDLRDLIEDFCDIKLPNANCVFFVPSDEEPEEPGPENPEGPAAN
jgi:hypothetical protein